MQVYNVEFHPRAIDDLIDIYDWVDGQAGPDIALGYVNRLEAFCIRLSTTPHRGSLRDYVKPNLRVIGFEKRQTIAFAIHDDSVVILRIFGKGRNWEAELFDIPE